MYKFMILALAVFFVLEGTGVSGCCWAPGLCRYGHCGGSANRYHKYKHMKEFWEQTESKFEQKEFLFAVMRSGYPYVYRDGDGVLTGFTLDVINSVCAIAEKTCYVSDLPPTGCSKTINNAFVPGDCKLLLVLSVFLCHWFYWGVMYQNDERARKAWKKQKLKY